MRKKGPDFVALDGLSIGNQHAIDAMMAVIAYFALNGETVRNAKEQVEYSPRVRQRALTQGSSMRVSPKARIINNPSKNFRF